ncbi:hypothetical protein [Sulfurimonas sp.]|uniref:hypothetical protein n=1 Tax=Sulfurimonas sp. TaxID=2022749 RepID=UPI00286E8B05|nr:hypothetical protein [Sulfurimonas sp.]
MLPLSLLALSITSQEIDINTKKGLQNAERKYGINENLLTAMSKVESDHNQYAIGTITNGLEQLKELKEYFRSL